MISVSFANDANQFSFQTALHTRILHHQVIDTDYAPNPHEINHAHHVKAHDQIQHLEDDKRMLHDQHQEHKEGPHIEVRLRLIIGDKL